MERLDYALKWGTTTMETGCKVINNIFENRYMAGVQLFYKNSPVVTGNTIKSQSSYTAFNGILYFFDRPNKKLLTFNNASPPGSGKKPLYNLTESIYPFVTRASWLIQ
jgi:hypothetical protein